VVCSIGSQEAFSNLKINLFYFFVYRYRAFKLIQLLGFRVFKQSTWSLIAR